MLALIPPPWNALAIFGLGILTKILHNRLTQPTPTPSPGPTPGPMPSPEPSNTPLLDALLAALRARLGRPVSPSQDIEPEVVGKVFGMLNDAKPK